MNEGYSKLEELVSLDSQEDIYFEKWIGYLKNNNFEEEEFVPLYWKNKSQVIMCSAMVSMDSQIKNIADSNIWLKSTSQGGGDVITTYQEEYEQEKYEAETYPIPLLRHRDLKVNEEKQKFEIAEEFRLFYDLFEDNGHKCNLYFWNDNGDKVFIVKYNKNQTGKETVMVRSKELKHFLFMKNCYLCIQTSMNLRSNKTLKELSIKEKRYDRDFVNKNLRYTHLIVPKEFLSDDKKSLSRFMSWSFVKGEKIKKEPKKFVNFWIKNDKHGNIEEFTCNPAKLADFYGKNPEAPNFLTHIFFKKEVLNKYYNNTNKYKVHDGMVECTNLWDMPIDNNIKGDCVSVYLGYLGDSLTHEEQNYWRSFNIYEPSLKGSATSFRRNVKAEFTDPESVDLYFKQLYKEFNKEWAEQFGWPFFNELIEENLPLIDSLKIPMDEKMDFGYQVIKLHKLIIESLNSKSMKNKLQETECAGSYLTSMGSIQVLELWFSYIIKHRRSKCEEMILFLKSLHDLRGILSHLSNVYIKEEKKFKRLVKILKKRNDFSSSNLSEVFEAILKESIIFMNTIEKNT